MGAPMVSVLLRIVAVVSAPRVMAPVPVLSEEEPIKPKAPFQSWGLLEAMVVVPLSRAPPLNVRTPPPLRARLLLRRRIPP